MRIYLLLFGSLAVAMGLPVQDWEPVQSLDVSQRERSPLLGDLLPQQGHVVQEDPKAVSQENIAEPNSAKQKEPVKVMSDESQETAPLGETEKAEENKETEIKEEPIVNEAKDQEATLMGQVEDMPSVNIVVPKMFEEEPIAEDPLMEVESAPEIQEIYQISPNEFVEEPEPVEDETFEEQERNIVEEEKLIQAEEPVMELEQEVHQRNPNEFVEEIDLDEEETFEEQEGKGLEEEELMAVEESDMPDVQQRNPNEFVEELAMGQQTEEEEPFVEDQTNFLQEEALMEAQSLEEEDDGVMELESEKSGSRLAYPGIVEAMQNEELMMANQVYIDNVLMNENLEEENTAFDGEPAQPAESNPVGYRKRWRGCTGVVIDDKCYVFFRGPSKAPYAEFFCQVTFTNGHLASVTSQYIHSQMMWLMNRSGGPTRTWIGGLKYLNTDHFIWLDGAQWSYEDWVTGKPDNTAEGEICVELLRDGQFNDVSCSELRPFICSYPV